MVSWQPTEQLQPLRWHQEPGSSSSYHLPTLIQISLPSRPSSFAIFSQVVSASGNASTYLLCLINACSSLNTQLKWDPKQSWYPHSSSMQKKTKTKNHTHIFFSPEWPLSPYLCIRLPTRPRILCSQKSSLYKVSSELLVSGTLEILDKELTE